MIRTPDGKARKVMDHAYDEIGEAAVPEAAGLTQRLRRLRRDFLCSGWLAVCSKLPAKRLLPRLFQLTDRRDNDRPVIHPIYR